MAGDRKHHDSLKVHLLALQLGWDKWMEASYEEDGMKSAVRKISQNHIVHLMSLAKPDAPLWEEGYIGESDIAAEFFILPKSVNIVTKFFADYVLAANAVLEFFPDIINYLELE